MNHDLRNHSSARRLLSLVLLTQFALTTPLHAASVALATAPLVNSTVSSVLPNLMFLMDNSGSMGQEHTPDWIMEYNMRNAPWTYDGEWNSPASNEKNCRDSADDDGLIKTALTEMDMCVMGDVPFTSSAINSQYYNPQIRYLPGANADGSSKPSQTDPTAVLLDGYNKHNQTQLGVAGTTINLTTEYPDRVWCTTKTPSAAQLIDTSVCRKNSNYLYPDATYKFGRDNDGTTANKNVLGVYGAPYYYSPVVTEYCRETELRNCVTSSVPVPSVVPDDNYIFPAKARWCSNTSLTTCQSVKTSTYIYPRYPGASTTAVAASGGKFRVGNNTPRTITNVTFGGSAIEILGASVTGTSRADLAAKVAIQISLYASNPDFTASVCNTDNVCLTSTTAAGASGNGSFNVTGSAGASNFTASSGGVTGTSAAAYTFTRTDINPTTPTYPKATTRTDCGTPADTTCTYADEITNFGNWYAYYRTRMQSMKSSVSNAFTPIGSNYRVGFMNICKGDYLPVASFDNSTAAIPAVAAGGSLTLTNRTALTGTAGKNVSSIKVGTLEILGATVNGAAGMSSGTFASNIAAQINAFASSPEFTAVAAGNLITITSTAAAGATANGTLSTTKTASTIAAQVNITGGVTAIGQKNYWYDKLFNTTASGCGTPLRSALATVGRIYAGKQLSVAGSLSGATIDPVQYSCQKNFTLLTTDGYWNSDTAASIMDLSDAAMGNMDSDSTLRDEGMYEGPTASSGSLADVAKYYYETDLRTTDLSNCTGSLGINVCQETAEFFTTQRMTTYTLGLGVDGTLSYVSDYKSATTGDFYNLKNGVNSTNWPVPAENTETAVDDLWHAAVNGRGTYFSAKDPAQLANGLNSALADIDADVGAASAAATSTLNPVAGNNFAYVASYSTSKWTGNLEARPINVATGVVSETAAWCVEDIKKDDCKAPKTIEPDTGGASTIYNCVAAGATLASCPLPGVFDAVAETCKVEITNTCTGTMPGKVAAATDTRTIYKSDGNGALQSFTSANVNAADFTAAGLSQWSLLNATQKTAAAANLVNYLRGQTGFEDRTSNPADNRLYRFREATLSDALESQPFFISKPVFSYADPGYAAYKAAEASRAGTVFMGTNDGMVHAFAADTGIERWAYVPSVVIPNMWKLADKNYATGHTNFVNGSPVVSDICTANCSCDDICVAGGGTPPVWRTILVGGLNAGGRSYYALDITVPDTPTFLWEISSSDAAFANLGFSYGQPIITKKTDGTWVVLVTSGYNNTSPGNGKGYLFVLKATDGSKISAYDTGVGDTTTPSGLAKVAAWNDFQGTNNTAGFVYGGDLLGNLWRFDINTDDTAPPLLFATLKDSFGNAQPVTATPTLGEILSQRVIFVGTGKYLEVTDLTNTSRQSIYAIKDDNLDTPLINARTSLVAQTMTMANADATARTGSNNPVNFASGRGWYIDLGSTILPAATPSFVGERVNIDMQLVQGTLIVATIVPLNTVCSPGGTGWLNFFNYETGGFVGPLTTVSQLYASPIVGINVIYIEGKPVVEVVTARKPTPEKDPNVQINNSASGFSAKRVIWRELIP